MELENKKEASLIDELNELYLNGKLKKLIDSGLVSSSVYLWRNIFNAYNFRLQASGSKIQAMNDVSLNFGVSMSTIRKVRRKFE
jgi:hypothetical protein